eukprot:2270147-Pleurochrysis_carterae.AAC.1
MRRATKSAHRKTQLEQRDAALEGDLGPRRLQLARPRSVNTHSAVTAALTAYLRGGRCRHRGDGHVLRPGTQDFVRKCGRPLLSCVHTGCVLFGSEMSQIVDRYVSRAIRASSEN